MMKKLIFSIIMIILIIPSTIFAFADELGNNIKPEAPEEISEMASVILGTIQWAGYAIAVGMLLYIAIKYIMSAANEKAALKQSLINWVIGAVIVSGVTTIFTGVVGFFREDLSPDEKDENGHVHSVAGWETFEEVEFGGGKTVYRYRVCSCGARIGEPVVLPRLPKDDVEDPVCQHLNVVGSEEDGYTCEDCGQSINDSSKPIVNDSVEERTNGVDDVRAVEF